MALLALRSNHKNSWFLAAVLLLALIHVVAGMFTAQPAEAHASLLESAPVNGQTIEVWPEQVTIRLSEPVSLQNGDGSAGVSSIEGTDVHSSVALDPEDPSILRIMLLPDQPQGVYLVNWRLVSVDTHSVAGTIQFGYGVPATGTIAVEPVESVSDVATAVLKVLIYVGLVLVLGVPMAARVTRLDSRRVNVGFVGGAVLLLVASLAQIPAQAVAVGGDCSSLCLDSWAGVAFSPFGAAIAVRILALGLLVGLVSRLRWSLPVLGAVIISSVVFNGHGATSLVEFSATWLHAAAATAWIGGLVLLPGVLLRTRLSADQLGALAHWSRYAGWCVAAWGVSGIVLSLKRVEVPQALLGTDYGRLLMVKLVVVAGALVLAWWGKRWITRAKGTGRPAPGATGRLRRRTKLELTFAASAALLAVTISTIPPAIVAWAPVENIEAQAGEHLLEIEVSPARAGLASIKVRAGHGASAEVRSMTGQLIYDGDRELAVAIEFPVYAGEPAAPWEPATMVFHSSDVRIPVAGTWTLHLEVAVDEITEYVAEIDVEIS